MAKPKKFTDANKARDYLKAQDGADLNIVDALADDVAIANANAHQDAAAAAAAADSNETTEAAPASRHVVKLKRTDGGKSPASFDGQTIEADAKGHYEVPHAAVAALASHGFEVVS